jgi:hypothetical protein
MHLIFSSLPSEALLEPMVGIGFIIEGFYLLVSRASVEADGFDERAVRLQAQNRNPSFPGVAL